MNYIIKIFNTKNLLYLFFISIMILSFLITNNYINLNNIIEGHDDNTDKPNEYVHALWSEDTKAMLITPTTGRSCLTDDNYNISPDTGPYLDDDQNNTRYSGRTLDKFEELYAFNYLTGRNETDYNATSMRPPPYTAITASGNKITYDTYNGLQINDAVYKCPTDQVCKNSTIPLWNGKGQNHKNYISFTNYYYNVDQSVSNKYKLGECHPANDYKYNEKQQCWSSNDYYFDDKHTQFTNTKIEHINQTLEQATQYLANYNSEFSTTIQGDNGWKYCKEDWDNCDIDKINISAINPLLDPHTGHANTGWKYNATICRKKDRPYN